MILKGISSGTVTPPEPVEVKPTPGVELRAYHPTDRIPLREALAADGAEEVLPTHVLERDGRIVGYGSAGVIRLIAGWTAPSVDDHVSAHALNLMERAVAATGAKVVVVGCTEDCRFKRLMAAEGYTEGRQVTLYYKKVKV